MLYDVLKCFSSADCIRADGICDAANSVMQSHHKVIIFLLSSPFTLEKSINEDSNLRLYRLKIVFIEGIDYFCICHLYSLLI